MFRKTDVSFDISVNSTTMPFRILCRCLRYLDPTTIKCITYTDGKLRFVPRSGTVQFGDKDWYYPDQTFYTDTFDHDHMMRLADELKKILKKVGSVDVGTDGEYLVFAFTINGQRILLRPTSHKYEVWIPSDEGEENTWDLDPPASEKYTRKLFDTFTLERFLDGKTWDFPEYPCSLLWLMNDKDEFIYNHEISTKLAQVIQRTGGRAMGRGIHSTGIYTYSFYDTRLLSVHYSEVEIKIIDEKQVDVWCDKQEPKRMTWEELMAAV